MLQRTKPAICAACVPWPSVHDEVTVIVFSPEIGTSRSETTQLTLIGPPDTPLGLNVPPV